MTEAQIEAAIQALTKQLLESCREYLDWAWFLSQTPSEAAKLENRYGFVEDMNAVVLHCGKVLEAGIVMFQQAIAPGASIMAETINLDTLTTNPPSHLSEIIADAEIPPDAE